MTLSAQLTAGLPVGPARTAAHAPGPCRTLGSGEKLRQTGDTANVRAYRNRSGALISALSSPWEPFMRRATATARPARPRTFSITVPQQVDHATPQAPRTAPRPCTVLSQREIHIRGAGFGDHLSLWGVLTCAGPSLSPFPLF